MRRLHTLGLLAAMALALPGCPGEGRTYTAQLPPTAECPSGLFVVTVKGATAVEVRCAEDPTPPQASPTPEPQPSPDSSPSAPPSPGPSPTPAPSASPSPAPSPSPTAPAPSPTPSASPTPKPYTECPEPYTIKLGFPEVPGRKLKPNGYANLGGATPLVRGACRHKGDPAPEAECAVVEACGDHRGSPYWIRYGQPDAWQWGTGFRADPVERATDGCNGDGTPGEVPCGYNFRFSTNSERLWTSGSFAQAGPMLVCVSLSKRAGPDGKRDQVLDHCRCQRGTMGADGLMRDFGPDQQSFTVARVDGVCQVQWP